MTLSPTASSMPRSSLERVRGALLSAGRTPKGSGDHFMVRCVCCDDKSPSLSVTWDGARGLTKLHSFCCEAPFADIMAAMGLEASDAFDEPMPERRRDEKTRRPARRPAFKAHKLPPRISADGESDDFDASAQSWDTTAVYSYVDAAGSVVQEVVREQCEVGGRTRKRFTQRFLGASGRMVSRKPTGFKPVLYNLADVLTGIAAEKPIWLLEGEKDVDNATKAGLIATTNAQGANSFPDDLVAVFDGASVNIVADRDVAGYTRALTLHARLSEVGARVRLYLPAVTTEKADLTDHLEAGHSIEELIPIGVDDAAALAKLGEAHRALSKIHTAQREATAHSSRAAETDDARRQEHHREHGRTWAAEAEIQVRRIRDLLEETRELDAGAIGAMARDDLRELRFTAADAAAEVFAIAEERLPSTIAEIQQARAKKGTSVIPIAGGAGVIPPNDRGHDKSWEDDDEQANEGTRFKVRHGETVEVKVRKDGDTYRNRYEIVIRGWGQVQSVDVEDDGNESHVTRVSHGMTVTFWRYKREVDGTPVKDASGEQIIEEETVHWDADQLKDGSWANALPWPGMLAKSSRQGREAAMDALLNARQAPGSRSTVYTASGWRRSDAGWYFVHAAGAIGKGGSLPLNVDLPGSYEPFKLPEPSTDAAALRQAWIDGTGSLARELPAKVLAPMLGGVWESVFDKVPMITHYQGGRSAAKTGLADLSLQYFAPGVHFHGKREILSGSAQGGTIIGLTRALGYGSYLPVLVDDFAPDGQPKKIQEKLSVLARQTFNNTGRTVGKQRGGVNMDKPILASVITTGELGTTGSADSRVMTIPIDPNMIPDKGATLSRLERKPYRDARALLGASLIRWIAEHRDALLDEIREDTEDGNKAAAYWRKRFEVLPHQAEIIDRLTSDAAARHHGVRLMLRMLVSQKALSTEEADQFNRWMENGLIEAYAAQETTASDPGEQLIKYLREALFSGDVHLIGAGGSVPEGHLAASVGWSTRGQGQFETWTPSGRRLGAIKGDRVFLLPAVALAAAIRVSNQADEMFAETGYSITSSFISHGWLVTDANGKRSVGRRIEGMKMKVWDIPLAALLGENELGDPNEGPTGDDAPTAPPSLFDLPVDDSATPEAATMPDAPVDANANADADVDVAPATGATSPAAPVDVPEAETPDDVVPAQTADAAAPAAAAPAPRAATRLATRSAKATAVSTSFRASLAVLHTDGLWFPDGENTPLPYAIEHLGDVARLVADLNLGTTVRTWRGRGGVEQRRDENGQLFVTFEAAVALGIPLDQLPADKYDVKDKLKELTTDHPMITDAIAAGWEVGGPAKGKFLNGVTRIWHSTNRDIRAQFILIPALKDDFAHLADDATPATLARRVQRFADALHFPFTISASTTGMNLMETLQWKEREVFFAPSNPVPPAMITTLEKDINWSRKPTDEELQHRFVHAYDRGGSYLAGVTGLSFGIGDPEHHPDGREFDKKLPGYWRIAMPERSEWLIPNPLDPQNRERAHEHTGKQIWVSTPTLEVAIDHGYELDPIEAYVWTKHHRLLDGWYERIRDARTELDTADADDQLARDLLKEVYVRSLGLMASHEFRQGQNGYAPERYHAIQARSRANILRRVRKIGEDTGRWPVAILKDTVLYTSNESDPEAAWPGEAKNYGRGLGQYKYEKSGLLTDQLRFLNGRGYEGKTELEELI